MKRRNVQDATLKNIHRLRARVEVVARWVSRLESRIIKLERKVKKL